MGISGWAIAGCVVAQNWTFNPPFPEVSMIAMGVAGAWLFIAMNTYFFYLCCHKRRKMGNEYINLVVVPERASTGEDDGDFDSPSKDDIKL